MFRLGQTLSVTSYF